VEKRFRFAVPGYAGSWRSAMHLVTIDTPAINWLLDARCASPDFASLHPGYWIEDREARSPDAGAERRHPGMRHHSAVEERFRFAVPGYAGSRRLAGPLVTIDTPAINWLLDARCASPDSASLHPGYWIEDRKTRSPDAGAGRRHPGGMASGHDLVTGLVLAGDLHAALIHEGTQQGIERLHD